MPHDPPVAEGEHRAHPVRDRPAAEAVAGRPARRGAVRVPGGLVQRHFQFPRGAHEHAPHVGRLPAPQAGKHGIGEEDVRVVARRHRLGVAGGEGGVEPADQGFVGVHGWGRKRLDPSQGPPILRLSILSGWPWGSSPPADAFSRRSPMVSAVAPEAKSKPVPSDIEIAQAAKVKPIAEVAKKLGIPDEAIQLFGRYKAKVALPYIDTLKGKPDGKLILVTAISPTPAGEGKTTTTVGLGDALNQIGKKAMICLREPSLGPVFGMKGGAAGGGYAQVVPMEDINLHFTGDFNAIQLANNLLAAMVDNHIHHGNALDIDVRRITWKRVLDMNDRALRDITVGLGGPANGFPREDGFDIVVASEVMAIFCLSQSLADLKERLGNIVVAYIREQKPVRARDLNAHGAMT